MSDYLQVAQLTLKKGAGAGVLKYLNIILPNEELAEIFKEIRSLKSSAIF